MEVGRYIVEERSRKEGGQAFVYFGIDRDTGARVAVKMARPSDWSQRRIRREIAIQGKLDHPNILPIIDSDGSKRWYAMAEATASLDDLGPFQRHEWTRLRVGLLGIADALIYAHGRGFVHRDLAPGNVLVFPDRWVISDWGFVYEEPRGGPRMTQPLERFGTPEFVAPELVADPRDVTPASDVYSIGRLAAWGTGLGFDQQRDDDDSLVRWWRALIDGGGAWNPGSRWTMRDVLVHLRSRPRLITRGAEQCPTCRSSAGRDASERCLSCHTVIPY